LHSYIIFTHDIIKQIRLNRLNFIKSKHSDDNKKSKKYPKVKKPIGQTKQNTPNVK